jgi:hypothetical protein
MDCSKSWSVDGVLLAKRMTEILDRPFTSAKIIDRGTYATVYQLIDASNSSASSSSLRRGIQPVVVRISSRPVYNDVAIDQEKQKILTFVATLDEIKGNFYSFLSLYPRFLPDMVFTRLCQPCTQTRC